MPVDQQDHWFPPSTIKPGDRSTLYSQGHTYRDPVPEPTAQTPGELLIKHYGDRSATKEWADIADPGRLLRIQQETQLQRRAVLPVGSAGLIGKWPRPEGHESVPVFAPISLTDPGDIVDFENQNGTLGISMKDILGEKWTCLQAANDIVLQRFKGVDVSFAIQWLGYEVQQSQIHTRLNRNRKALTRVDLAVQITMAYAAFFGKVEKDFMLPSTVGFYNIALHQGRDAREDSLGVQFTQLRLMRFYRTVNGCFVAQIDIA